METKFYEMDGKIIAFRTKNLQDHLPTAVYDLKLARSGFYLKKSEPLKQFDLYCDSSFYDRIVREFNKSDKNLGAYFHGNAGTGKTVACNYICKELNLPVICIDEHFDGEFIDFIVNLNQKAIIYFDEADKIFSRLKDERDFTNDLLTLLDGKHQTNLLFLLTSNQLVSNDYLYSRLQRLKYYKIFDTVSLEDAEKVVDSTLNYTHHKENLMKVLSMINPLTFDIIESLVEDINIHDEDPLVAASHFCLTTSDGSKYQYYEMQINGNVFTPVSDTDIARLKDFYVRMREVVGLEEYVLDNFDSKLVKSNNLHFNNGKRIFGSEHQYEYDCIELDTKVYLKVRQDKLINNKLFIHESER